MNREPVFTVATITSAVAAVVALVVAFGVPLTEDQQTAILSLAAVVAPLIAAYFARKRVTPVRTTARHVPNQRGAVDYGLIAIAALVLAVVCLVLILT